MQARLLKLLSLSAMLLLVSCGSLDKELQPRRVITVPAAEKPEFPKVVLEELESLAVKYRLPKSSKD